MLVEKRATGRDSNPIPGALRVEFEGLWISAKLSAFRSKAAVPFSANLCRVGRSVRRTDLGRGPPFLSVRILLIRYKVVGIRYIMRRPLREIEM